MISFHSRFSEALCALRLPSAATLVEGITAPNLPNAKSATFEQWPKSLKGLAHTLAKLADQK